MVDELRNQDIDEIVAGVGTGKQRILPILKAIQERYHYLPDEALRRVCEVSDITPAAIEGVSSFYSLFRRVPAGRHTIRICVGTACFVKGADQIYSAFKLALRIPEKADTDRDRLFTVEKAACLGCCMLAPAVQIDDVVYGYLTRQKVPAVLKDFLEKQETGLSDGEQMEDGGKQGEIRLCTCTSCRASGAQKVFDELAAQVERLELPVSVKRTGCHGISYRAPLVEVRNDGESCRKGEPVLYSNVTMAYAGEILWKHFRSSRIGKQASRAAGRLLDRLLSDDTREPVAAYSLDLSKKSGDGAFVTPQVRIVTGDVSDPLDIDGYISAGGFTALRAVIARREPEKIIELVKQSGLRGRGGGGYSTARKLALVRDAAGDEKYVICNGDEGDPGAFMDRMILESHPYKVIEGLAIAAYAVGADKGVFYIRAEYPLAIRRIEQAIKTCQERDILGSNVFLSDFSLDVVVEEGAGAFVCGEETALIAAVEGNRGTPRVRPPYPAESGLWDKPTLINNVETLATIPWIVKNGSEAFCRLGTAGSKGTKTFALAGKINRGGLIEVPMGMTLLEIVQKIGGGVQDDKRLKAIQIGGPSGGCIPASMADLPVDYEGLTDAGAIMGSGGLVVLDETDCMVDIARYFMAFTQSESCGKCTCCRVGSKRMLEILESLCSGTARKEDIKKLEELGRILQEGSLCGLGRTAPNPVLSTLRHFHDEYIAHLDGRCPAGRCKELITYSISDTCIGCTRCAQHCPASAIEMEPYEKHEIDQSKCIRCGTCSQVCPVDAVKVE